MKATVKLYLLRTIKTMALPVITIIILGLLTGGRSLNGRVLLVSLKQSILLIIMSIAIFGNMTLGMLDFSAGGVVLASAIIGGNLMMMTGTGIPGLIFFCMLSGVVLASLTGFLNNKLRIPIVVLTLGMMLVYEAIPRALFFGGAIIGSAYTKMALQPWIFIILGLVLVAFYVLYNHTTYGHNIRALGGNEEIAKNAGLNPPKIKQIGFTISGVFLGVAAALYMSINGSVTNVAMFGSLPIVFNGLTGVLLAVFLSRYCNIVIGILIGNYTLTVLINGLVSLGVSATLRDALQGAAILIVMVISANQGRLKKWRADKERKAIAERSYVPDRRR